MQQVGVAESGSSSETAAANTRKKVVVIGAGWAGLAAAYELSKQVGSESSSRSRRGRLGRVLRV